MQGVAFIFSCDIIRMQTMKDFGKTIKEIYTEHRRLLLWMIMVLLVSVGLFFYGVFSLDSSSSATKIGYGDIGSYQGGDFAEMQNAGGYRDGGWMEMMAFPFLALVIGVLHLFITIRLYQKKGESTAEVFIVMSLLVLGGAWITLIRLLGEG